MIKFVKINTSPGRTFPQHSTVIVPFNTTFPKGQLLAVCTSGFLQSRVKLEPTVSLSGPKGQQNEYLNISL